MTAESTDAVDGWRGPVQSFSNTPFIQNAELEDMDVTVGRPSNAAVDKTGRLITAPVTSAESPILYAILAELRAIRLGMELAIGQSLYGLAN